jgi:glutamyl-tRNA synthetase
MSWTDPVTGEVTPGFREIGFLPEAFINMLAMLGWNDGTEQELFSLEELIEKFSLEHVSKAGAKFNYEKARWFNAEWIKRTPAEKLYPEVSKLFVQQGIEASEDKLLSVIDLVKDRCTFTTDFVQQAGYFFRAPAEYDLNSVQPKWSEQKEDFFHAFSSLLASRSDLSSADLEAAFKQLSQEKGLKVGDVMLPYRIMLVGGKFGPAVFDITKVIGEEEAVSRIAKALIAFKG